MVNQDWIIYEVLSGSRAYGLNTENSDYDWRGIAIPPKEYFYSPFKVFEQSVETNPDKTIFSLNKFIKLASACNPNVLELLFIDEKHIKTSTPQSKLLRENRDLFLSARVKHTYTGYAYSQLHRIKNHKKWFDKPIEKPNREDFNLQAENKIFNNNIMKTLIVNFRNYITGELINDLSEKYQELDKDILNANLGSIINNIPKSFFEQFSIKFFNHLSESLIKEEYQELLKNEYNFWLKNKEYKEYVNWKNNRNKDRASFEKKYGYDIKHGTHLLRLMYNGLEILEKGTLTVDVSNIDYIVKTRRGEMPFKKLIEEFDKLDKQIEELYNAKKYVVPYNINTKKIEKLTLRLLNKGEFL